MLLASDYDKSKYLKGVDLEREKKFRIKVVTEEELTDNAGKKEKKPVVWFTSIEQGLVLNKTNLRTLRGAFGDRMKDWETKVVAIFPMMADNGKPGLRIRILPPKQDSAAAAAPPSGNGAATPSQTAPTTPKTVGDPELEPDSAGDEMDDEIPF
jgi:hypothetical protein